MIRKLCMVNACMIVIAKSHEYPSYSYMCVMYNYTRGHLIIDLCIFVDFTIFTIDFTKISLDFILINAHIIKFKSIPRSWTFVYNFIMLATGAVIDTSFCVKMEFKVYMILLVAILYTYYLDFRFYDFKRFQKERMRFENNWCMTSNN